MRSYYDRTGTIALNHAGCEAIDMLHKLMGEGCQRIVLTDIAYWSAQAALPEAGPAEQSLLAAEVNEKVIGLWLEQVEGRA